MTQVDVKPGVAWAGIVARVGGWWLLLVLLAAPALAGTGRNDCEGESPARLLRAALPLADPTPQQAVWLEAWRLRWPQVRAEAGSRFVLVHSPQAGLQVRIGQPVRGAAGRVVLHTATEAAHPGTLQRHRHVAAGIELVVRPADQARVATLHRQQLVLVQLDARQRVLRHSPVQHAVALDDLHAVAAGPAVLGASVAKGRTQFQLWAPTAQHVALCLQADASAPAAAPLPLRREADSGVWTLQQAGDLSGRHYRYLVDVVVPGVGLVRNRVTDPYALALSADSLHSVVVDLDNPALKPPGWDQHATPATVQANTDLVIYELHVRDFSITDTTVPEAYRGKYAAFTQADSAGMQHLAALARAGLTDVHLLPVFDIASIPERGCSTPAPAGPPDGEQQQATVMAGAATDCFNWGYDPLHYTVPEGSYASSAADPLRRIIEFRQMVQALHATGLRVGMDVVYNHTSASGQHAQSVLDRIVPGYYHRLDAQGRVERSTCCDNTATEHAMMARLMNDSVLTWARHYRIDSFRFDLMGHQPRDVMLQLKARLRRELGRELPLIGEGWNFGEVADGARFVQASQRSLAGTGIATFSDRARDALRGRGGLHAQGWLNGLGVERHPLSPAPASPAAARAELLAAADMVRVGLAGSLAAYVLHTAEGREQPLSAIAYGQQPAGYVNEPGEVVNYVENHDNPTLFDNNAGKLPTGTSREDRTRLQMLGAATVALSQGVAYFHAGQDILRSKSMDANSFDSGDWFNRLDWSYQTNHFGTGLPPRADNGASWPAMRALLADAGIPPTPAEIAWSRDAFRDLLRIRTSSPLFRLRSAAEVQRRLRFHGTGPEQSGTLILASLDGQGLAGAGFAEIVYALNVDRQAQSLAVPALQGRRFRLHPVLASDQAADARPRREAAHDPATGRFTVPARSVVVWVRDEGPLTAP